MFIQSQSIDITDSNTSTSANKSDAVFDNVREFSVIIIIITADKAAANEEMK